MAVILASELKWYGSGASNLGGAISGTEVVPSTLFDAVTGDEASAGDDEYRCVYFRNTSANTGGLQNSKLWISTQTPGGDDIAIALAGEGKNGTAETVSDENTAPSGESFTAPSTKAGGISLPTPLSQNDYIGVWIKRHVPASTAAYNSNTFTLSVEGDSSA